MFESALKWKTEDHNCKCLLLLAIRRPLLFWIVFLNDGFFFCRHSKNAFLKKNEAWSRAIRMRGNHLSQPLGYEWSTFEFISHMEWVLCSFITKEYRPSWFWRKIENRSWRLYDLNIKETIKNLPNVNLGRANCEWAVDKILYEEQLYKTLLILG